MDKELTHCKAHTRKLAELILIELDGDAVLVSVLASNMKLAKSTIYRAITWLRENELAHVSSWTEKLEMVIRAGKGVDAARPCTRPAFKGMPPRPKFTIPAPCPVLAAFYGLAEQG